MFFTDVYLCGLRGKIKYFTHKTFNMRNIINENIVLKIYMHIYIYIHNTARVTMPFILPGAVLLSSYYSNECINSSPFQSQKNPTLDDKLYNHVIYGSCSKGAK